MSTPSNSAIFQYSILALPLAFAGLPLYIHAPDFYTRDLGMNIGLIGMILLAVRLIDAVQDPVIGYLSDRFSHQRFAIIAGGMALLTSGMAAVFFGPQFGISITLWFVLAMVLATTGFSIVTINLNMIGGFWQSAPDQRTRISAWRESFALSGLLVASVLPAALHTIKPAKDAFEILIYVFGGLALAAFLMFTRFMKRISPGHAVTKGDTAKGLSFLSILLGAERRFFAVCFLTHLAAAMPGVMVLFFIRDYLGAEDLSGLFLSLYFIAGAVLMPVWVKLARVTSKQKAWLISMLLAIITFGGACVLQPGDVVAYGIICVLSGMALGADLALPPSLLADRINAHKDEGQATQYYALLAFIPKVAIAIASGVSFMILDQLGFVAGADNTPQALQGLITLYALVPCGIKLLAAGLLWRSHHFHEGDKSHVQTHKNRSTSHGTAHLS